MTTKAEALADLDVIDICLDTADHRLGDKHKARFDRIRDFINSTPEWQPMSSAPRDGTVVLVLLPRSQNLIIRARYNRVHKYWETDCERAGLTRPTFFHEGDLWQPLPTPPITGETK